MNIKQKIQLLQGKKALFAGNLIGIEKESLRISKSGKLSQTPHPTVFGSALTHPHITTDFSEALIELVTPPLNNTEKALEFLTDTQHYLLHNLPSGQGLWASSMPSIIRGKTHIPIAQYGKSNQGMMKTIYRLGLANRYGSEMQAIAGIHFNYSFSAEFWQYYQKLLLPNETLRAFIDSQYMSLTRNILRYGWLISYLFGSSAAVDKSFLQGISEHSLVEFDRDTLFEPYATSLRMGDIGYQNLREDEAGVKANYNSLAHYVSSLKSGMETVCEQYEQLGLKKNGKYQQLSTGILQIENEYYASVRPKPKFNIGEKPLDALAHQGIDYIELRSIDINPMLPLGIDEEQIYFLEAFMLFCLLQNSPAIATTEQAAIDKNDQLIAHQGRKPRLVLSYKDGLISRKNWGIKLIDKIAECAALLGKKHIEATSKMRQRIIHPTLTPSAQILQQMTHQKQSFFAYTLAQSHHHQAQFLSHPINQNHFTYLAQKSQESTLKQTQIEKSDQLNFDDFLANYLHSDGVS